MPSWRAGFPTARVTRPFPHRERPRLCACWPRRGTSGSWSFASTIAGRAGSPGLDRERLRDGTCLVTGGLGALGLLTARWLVDAGAHSLVLVGRRSPQGPAAVEIEAIEARGARVRVVSADISDRASVASLLETIDRELPPLVGIVHAAGILEDATLANVEPDQFRRVLAGKASGAVHLHELTADRSLALPALLVDRASRRLGGAGELRGGQRVPRLARGLSPRAGARGNQRQLGSLGRGRAWPRPTRTAALGSPTGASRAWIPRRGRDA